MLHGSRAVAARRFVCACIAVIVMTPSSVLAQRAALNQLFRNRNLTCMFADTRGFVWLCTSRGLVRFDGRSEFTFGETDGLPVPPPNIVFEDSGGGLWVGGAAGLFEMNTLASGTRPQAFSRVLRPDGGAIGPVYGFSNSGDGTIWCASGTGLWRMTRREGRTIVSKVDLGLANSSNDPSIRVVLEDPQRTLWAGSSHGLYRRGSDGRLTRLSTRDGFPSDEITVLAWADGYLWAGTGNGVARLRTDAPVGTDPIRTFTAVDGLPAAPVTALSVENDGVRVSTSGGTAGIFPAASSRPQVVASNRVVSGGLGRTRDAAGNFWSATAAGAFRILGHKFDPGPRFRGHGLLSLLRVDQGVCGIPIQPRSPAVCEQSAWLLNEVDALGRLDFKSYFLVNAPSIGWSALTATDSRGRWFIPTPRGIAQFASRGAVEQSLVEKMWTASDGLPPGDVTALYGDSEGGVWAGIATSHENRIVRLFPDGGRIRVFGTREGYSPRLPPARTMTDDRRGTLWIGLDQSRVVRFQNGGFSELVGRPSNARGEAGHRDHTSALASGSVTALLVDGLRRLWIGTSTAGLGRLDSPDARNPHIVWYRAADGLGSDRVTALLEDDAKAVLVGTDRDLARIRPDTGAFTHHTLTDGKPGDAIVAAARDVTGNLWLATVGHEVLRRPPGRAALKPTFVLSVKVDHEPQWVPANGAGNLRGITVPRGARTLEISWSSPDADLLDPVHYEQQLVPPGGVGRRNQASTVTTGRPVPSADRRRTISLAEAKPGAYEFAVRTVSPDGNVGDEARVEFIVLAPLWQRWGFLAPLGLAIALIFYWVRTRQLAGVVRLRSRIASDLHDTVGARLSRITILSDVVRQQAPDQPPEVISALAAIGDNARAVVDDMSDAVWFINPACDGIHQLVVRVRTVAAAIFEQTPIAWSVNVQPDAIARKITADQRRHIYLVVKEGLTNVLRHAGASIVSVNLELHHGRLRVIIADDGAGQAGTEDGEMARLGGNGIVNMRRRAEELGGTLAIDLTHGNGGTHVVLDVPLGGRR